MNLKEFYYHLPKELIAQGPLEKRDESRLLVLDRKTGDIQHKKFKEIINLLDKKDCLVINDTKVIPARLLGHREDTGGKIEFVLLNELDEGEWEVLVKPGKRAKVGTCFVFGEKGELRAKILSITPVATRIIKFYYDGVFNEILDKLGKMPLPPYIKKQLKDKTRYQTVYAKKEGSAAAPTAGLHFTEELLTRISEKGVKILNITLHVGLGTFRPVKVDDITQHKMHSEYYHVDAETAQKINEVRENGGRVWAVGTTTVRTLETVVDKNGKVKPGNGWTDIFIYPGFKFKAVDAMITNFHLPESTLLMLVCAFAGKDLIFKAYKEAIREKYRFFSFGDAMAII